MPRLLKKILLWTAIVVVALYALGWLALVILEKQAERDLAKARQALIDQGAPMTLEEVLRPPVPEDENALPILKIAEAYKEANSESLSDTEIKIWDALEAQYPETWVPFYEYNDDVVFAIRSALNEPTVTEFLTYIEEAASKPYYWRDLRGITIDDYAKNQVPTYLSVTLTGARLLRYRAELAALDGNTTLCYSSIASIFALAKLFEQCESVLGQLTYVALLGIGVQTIEDVSKVSAIETADIIKSEHDFSSNECFYRAIETENVTSYYWLENVAKNEIARNFLDYFLSDNQQVILELMGHRPFRWLVLRDQVQYLKLRLKMRAAFEFPSREAVQKIQNISVSAKELSENNLMVLSGFVFSVYGNIIDKKHISNAYIAITRTALSLLMYHNDHGEYPATLEALVPEYIEEIPLDPFTDEPLVYRKVDEGFQLYSLGPDQADDGGYEDPLSATEYDISWQGRGAVAVERPVAE